MSTIEVPHEVAFTTPSKCALTWFGQALEVFSEQSPKCNLLWANGQALNVLSLTIDSTKQDKAWGGCFPDK